MADFDRICAALCLMTNAAELEDMPPPLSRAAMRRLIQCGALHGLVLRETAQTDAPILERARLLLSRAKHVYECLERYMVSGYEVILPSDAAWPERLFALGDRMPQYLFLRGNRELLHRDRIAVAGSRDIQPVVQRASASLGRKRTEEGFCLVSGGARGVDIAAECGALESGGSAIIVPALSESRFFDEKHRINALDDGRMLVIYDTLPDDPFSAQKALARNHLIYALGEAAIAVAPRHGTGGTWHGAADCLSMRCTPVYIPQGDTLGGAGAVGLLARGAKHIDLSQPLRQQLRTAKQTDLFSRDYGEENACRQS